MKGKFNLSIFLLILISFQTGCSVVAPKPTETLNPTETPTPVPTLTPTETLTPTPTFTPTPTPVPTPSNLNLDLFYKYVTIDPYKFYIEEKGYIKVPRFNIVYEYLDKEKGDDITGDSENGWYITYDGQTVYYGPGIKTPDGTMFEMGVGKKESDGSINIIERKKFSAAEGMGVSIYHRTWWPGPPRFDYYPAKSTFILIERENPEQNYVVNPDYAGFFPIMVTKDYQMLPFKDTEKWPHWCIQFDEWKNGTVGYTIDGELFYWGTLPNGEIKCPILKVIEE